MVGIEEILFPNRDTITVVDPTVDTIEAQDVLFDVLSLLPNQGGRFTMSYLNMDMEQSSGIDSAMDSNRVTLYGLLAFNSSTLTVSSVSQPGKFLLVNQYT